MATITITINTDNDAFNENFITEMTYVVNQIPEKVVQERTKLQDSYGNTVGSIEVS